MYINIHIQVYIHIYTSRYAHIYTNRYAHIYTSIYAHIYTSIYVHTYIQVYMFVKYTCVNIDTNKDIDRYNFGTQILTWKLTLYCSVLSKIKRRKE